MALWQKLLAFFPEVVKGNSGAGPSIDWTKGTTQSLTLNAATVTPTFVNPPGGADSQAPSHPGRHGGKGRRLARIGHVDRQWSTIALLSGRSRHRGPPLLRRRNVLRVGRDLVHPRWRDPVDPRHHPRRQPLHALGGAAVRGGQYDDRSGAGQDAARARWNEPSQGRAGVRGQVHGCVGDAAGVAANGAGVTVEDPSNGGTFGATGAIQAVAGGAAKFKYRASDKKWIAWAAF